ncbi:MAG: dockerin [Chitinispirillia bacterium]|nr:dockerin [Chitinispirillia bacterium]MCL2268174.1 dockerin [Chitinispirillia bacterium]
MKAPSVIGMVLLACAIAATPVLGGTMQVEKLNRGLIAVRSGSGYYLSWRLLANEPYTAGFNVYRGTTKLNASPIIGATIYTDASAAQNSVYTVRAVINGSEQEASDPAIIMNNTEGSNSGYLHIPLQRPPTGAQGGTYSPGDGSVGDLDGDGVYEIILKWDPNNQKDNSQEGITDNVIIDAYKLDGTRLWRIDLGQNIRAGAHYTQFMVYDFDGDGKAEMMVKTAPGTKDATGAFISMGPAATANHSTAHRNANGHVAAGPEYFTVFDGATGKELATVNYVPERDPISGWGGAGRDNGANRSQRYNAAVAYLDGERPSAVFQRGYYERMVLVAWDWRNGQLTRRWTFDSNSSGNSAYSGQGNHQLSVADVDNSGRHSIITGAAVIGPNGQGMHTTGLGHADALHVAHMIKGHPTPQIYLPQESNAVGVSLRHANNGNVIFKVDNDADVGRACAGFLDASRPGFVFWAASSIGLLNTSGTNVGGRPGPMNHIIWWAGDLTRALLDGNTITRWSIAGNSGTTLLSATGSSSINGTKSNPVLQADIFGDWREEVIFANGTSALRIYTSTMTTTHRLVTLMHDPVYRVAVAWQNSSYNQPPHPGYYIASDMDFPPPALNVAVIGGGGITPPPPNPCDTEPGSTACCSANPAHSSCPAIPPPPNWAYIGSGELIDSLILFDMPNAAAWSVNQNFGTGSKIFGDRDYLAGAAIPADLQGAEWAGTSMETRRLTAPNTIARFRVKQNGTVYVMYEDRVTPKPSWLAAGGFTATSLQITVNDNQADRTFTAYSKSVSAGDSVTLGINSNDGTTQSLMYLVAVQKAQPTSVLAKTPPARYALKISQAGKGGAINVNYSIKDRGTVRIDLFDLRGNRVKTLLNTAKSAGAYTERVSTSGLAAGAYVVKLRAGSQMLQERVLIAK